MCSGISSCYGLPTRENVCLLALVLSITRKNTWSVLIYMHYTYQCMQKADGLSMWVWFFCIEEAKENYMSYYEIMMWVHIYFGILTSAQENFIVDESFN